MKKLLLLSMFLNTSRVLGFVEPELKNKTVTYIPTASKVEPWSYFNNIIKYKLKKMGLSVDELEVSRASYGDIKCKLEKNDLIYVLVGNTFFLMQELKRTGTDNLIIQEVNKGKLYIGESAGAIIAADNIGYISEMDSMKKAPKLKEYAGLNLIDFCLVPHHRSLKFGKAAKRIIKKYAGKMNLQLITDRQAILVENDKIILLSNKDV